MDEIPIKLDINGKIFRVNVKPYWTLLYVLRKKLGLTGTKDGCESGECGACAVLLDGKAVNSCLVLAVSAEGKKIVTIEGLTDGGKLHPLQRAFIDHFAVQCGYCTPGVIITAKALLDETPHPSEEDVRSAIKGNLCRCTGYNKMIEAILAASRVMSGRKSR